MRTALALLAALATSASAGTVYDKPPSHSTAPEVVAADNAWQLATYAYGPAAVTAWRAAGVAFDKAVAVAGAEAAYAAVLAWKNAQAAAAKPPEADATRPTPFVRDEAELFAALGVYLPLAPASDAPGIAFLRGNMLRRHHRFDEAASLFADVVTHYPADESAEYAANLLLDTLDQQAKYDELADWVNRMRANAKLLAGRDELVATLDHLHSAVLRKRAEALEEAGEHGDPHGFARCAQTYLDAYRQHPRDDQADEVLYSAGICLQLAGANADAIKTFHQVEVTFPQSRLARLAHARVAKLQP